MLSAQTLWQIITEIAPFYNKYKSEKESLTWTEALEIKWEIWNILKKYIDEYKIEHPHNLFWDIYWKWYSEDNVVQRSYITRIDQERCYRIRNIFQKKSDIKKTLPTLVSFTAFRESMPFFTEWKYKFTWKNMEDLLKLLNSNTKPALVLKEIKKLKDKYIWIKNPRTQKLWAMRDWLKLQFVDVFNNMKYLFTLSYEELVDKLEEYNLSQKNLWILSSNIRAFTNDRYQMTIIDETDIKSNEWKDLITSINNIIANKKIDERRRVQRVAAPNVLALISDMIMALTNEEYFDNYKKNRTN